MKPIKLLFQINRNYCISEIQMAERRVCAWCRKSIQALLNLSFVADIEFMDASNRPFQPLKTYDKFNLEKTLTNTIMEMR